MPQVLRLLTTTTLAVLTILSLVLAVPIWETLGAPGCFVYWLSAIIYCLSLGYGAIGTALFRLMYIKYPITLNAVIGQFR